MTIIQAAQHVKSNGTLKENIMENIQVNEEKNPSVVESESPANRAGQASDAQAELQVAKYKRRDGRWELNTTFYGADGYYRAANSGRYPFDSEDDTDRYIDQLRRVVRVKMVRPAQNTTNQM